MYNLLSNSVIVQQAKKKPLVTELLLRSSYTRGWRCNVNYGQFSLIGQVNTKSIAKRSHLVENGDDFAESPTNASIVYSTLFCFAGKHVPVAIPGRHSKPACK